MLYSAIVSLYNVWVISTLSCRSNSSFKSRLLSPWGWHADYLGEFHSLCLTSQSRKMYKYSSTKWSRLPRIIRWDVWFDGILCSTYEIMLETHEPNVCVCSAKSKARRMNLQTRMWNLLWKRVSSPSPEISLLLRRMCLMRLCSFAQYPSVIRLNVHLFYILTFYIKLIAWLDNFWFYQFLVSNHNSAFNNF